MAWPKPSKANSLPRARFGPWRAVMAGEAATASELARPCTDKSRLVSSGWSLSGLPPKADIRQRRSAANPTNRASESIANSHSPTNPRCNATHHQARREDQRRGLQRRRLRPRFSPRPCRFHIIFVTNRNRTPWSRPQLKPAMTLGVSGALQQEARPAREGRASPALGGWRRQSVQVPRRH